MWSNPPPHRWDKKADMVWRTTWGLFIASVIGPSVVLAVLFAPQIVRLLLKDPATTFYVCRFIFFGVVVYGWPIAIVAGLPFHLLFLKMGWVHVRHYVALGIVMFQLAVFTPAIAFVKPPIFEPLHLPISESFILMGAFTGWIFWLIVFWRNKYFIK